MTAMEHIRKAYRLPSAAEVIIIAFLFALIVTACGWFWVGAGSPLNPGVSLDVYNSPPAMLWVIANFPAGVLFVNAFGKHGPEWSYFLCVLIQWLIFGFVLGVIIASIRRTRAISNEF